MTDENEARVATSVSGAYLEYWDHFYEQPHPEIREPSPFARFCAPLIGDGATLFELGCGNGRDALYFARRGISVTACDQSHTAVDHLDEAVAAGNGWTTPPRFIVRRFEELTDGDPWEVVYSRFTLHTVDASTASRTLRWAFRNLRPEGRLLVEARTVKDELYGQGEPSGRDAFIHDGHYRRFVRTEELTAELSEIGFDLDEVVEAAGLATFGTSDPVVVRTIARRRADTPADKRLGA